MNRHCEYFESLIEQIPDGSLSQTELQELQAHIRTCPACQRLHDTYAAMTLSLRENAAQPPAAFAGDVMAHIRAYEKGAAEKAHASPRRRKSRQVQRFAAAACLVLIVGAGVFSMVTGRLGGLTGKGQYESVSMAFDTAEAADAASAPQAAPEEPMEQPMADKEFSLAGDESAAEGVNAGMDMAADSGAGSIRSTLGEPVYVPEGQEDAFEALLSDARWPEGEPKADWHIIAAVEYHGVIYQFLTDDDENFLLWQDAAEGLPVHSPGSVAELWDILG